MIEVQHPDQTQRLNLSTVLIEGVDYVEFPKLVELVGGAYRVLPKRMRVDLEGTTAWVGLNDNRVNALSIFSLSHTIVSNEDGIFIALSDCVPFFKKAFRLPLVYTTPTRVAGLPGIAERPVEPGGSGEQMLPVDSPETSPMVLEAKPYTSIQTVLVDPGHGGYEPGVEGASGTAEKDIALVIAQKLEVLLRDMNQLLTVHTREQDVSLSTQQRSMISLNTQADLLISVHAGGAFSEETQGVAIFYPASRSEAQGATTGLTWADYSEESREIAVVIAQSIVEETGAAFRGVHSIPNALFRQSRRPSILIEVGCLTNPQEEALLADELYQAKIATGIANGIQQLSDRGHAISPTPTLNNESIESEAAPL